MKSNTALAPLRTSIEFYSGDVPSRITVVDPVRNRHYLMSRVAVDVLNCFDGVRSADEVANRLKDSGIYVEPQSVRNLAEQAFDLGLLEGSDDNASMPTHATGPSRRNPFFWEIISFSPERVIRRLMPITRWLFRRPGLIAQALAVVLVIVIMVTRWSEIGQSMQRFRDPVYVVALWILFGGMTIVHEFGHALATATFGGPVKRMGLALYLLAPAAFVDTSAGWRMPRRQRLIISLAGVHFEHLIVTLLMIVAAVSGHGWVRDIAWGGAVTSMTRILANLNPTLRLDGYFVLSDLLRITNLRAKGFTVLFASLPVVGRHFRPVSFVKSGDEKTFLFVYGLACELSVICGVAMGTFMMYLFLSRWIEPRLAAALGLVLCIVMIAMALFATRRYASSLSKARFVGPLELGEKGGASHAA